MGEGRDRRPQEPGSPDPQVEGVKIIQEKARLHEGVTPMTREIVDMKEGNEELEDIQEGMEADGLIHSVDLDRADRGDLDELKDNGFKHGGVGSYLISPISERDWTSDHYFDCTGVVAIGKDKNTGKEISFLTHQDPAYFVDGDKDKVNKFSQELTSSLEELKVRSEEGTVEALLLGGNLNTDTDADSQPSKFYTHEHYKKSIKKLRQIVHESLGFDPEVVTGPNNRVGSETIATIETQKRKVWIERSKQPPEFDQPYQANMFDEAEKRWLSGESD